jgi:hypothetical protein
MGKMGSGKNIFGMCREVASCQLRVKGSETGRPRPGKSQLRVAKEIVICESGPCDEIRIRH